MRKRTMQFGGEHKISIHCKRLARPHLRQLRLDVPVKRSIDLYQIKALCQIFQRMFPSPLHPRRVKHTFPILIGPPGSADADLRRRFHEPNCRLAQAEFMRRDDRDVGRSIQCFGKELQFQSWASVLGRARLQSGTNVLEELRLQPWVFWKSYDFSRGRVSWEGHDFSRAVR